MAENLSKKPAKGILKTSSSFDHTEVHKSVLSLKQQGKSAASSIGQTDNKDIKWDEMNILQTLHPPDKDYGHMKIEEPKTPYSYYREGSDEVDGGRGSDNEGEAIDAELLAKKISLGSDKLPKALKEADDESEEDENETEEERAKRKAFEYKRKMHYNEYYAVKLARKLMPNDEEDEDDDEEEEEEEDSKDHEKAEKEVADEKKEVVDVDV